MASELNEENITLTPAACEHVHKWVSKEQGIGFRVSVKNTGCSGKAYLVNVIHTPDPNDKLFEQANGLKVYADAKEWAFIKGLKIDYVRKNLGYELTYDNPNQKSSCGCGESFNV